MKKDCQQFFKKNSPAAICGLLCMAAAADLPVGEVLSENLPIFIRKLRRAPKSRIGLASRTDVCNVRNQKNRT